MRVTIVPLDKKIRRNDVVVELPDWPFDDSSIHAIQWYETEGEIEYTGRPKPANEMTTDAAILQPYLDALDAYLASLPPEPAPEEDGGQE
jgi:hypothetical protein